MNPNDQRTSADILSTHHLQLLQLAANGELNSEQEQQLERLLQERPQAIEVLQSLTEASDDSRLLKNLSGSHAIPSPLVEAMQRLTTGSFDSGAAASDKRELKMTIPDLSSAGLTLVRKLGQGGYGVVYEGYDQTLDRPVAVKFLSGHWSDNDRARENLLQEAQVAAQLQHENVVSIYSIHLAQPQPYLLQQFVRGESLDQRISRTGPLAVDELLNLTTHLARGLDAAHRLGIIHRDLKPANILIEESSNLARIVDFGIARRQPSEPATAQPNQPQRIEGTPSFMSPEQTLGKPLDCRSDLFSLGSVLYAAATGVLPFKGNDTAAVLEQVRNLQPPELRAQRSEIPGWWCDIVQRLLAKNPDDRFESAQALLESLAQQRYAKKRKLRRPVVIGMLVAACLAIVWLAVGHPTAESLPSQGPGPDTPQELPWFEVVGNPTRYTLLEEALAQATAGSLVILHGQGEVDCEPIELTDKPLAWEMERSSKVILRPRNQSDSQPFIRTNAPLRLVNIHIDSDRRGEMRFPVGSTIESTQGELSLTECTIRERSFIACLTVLAGSALLENCRLEASEGLGVVVPHTGVELSIKNCGIKANNMAFVLSGEGISPTDLPATRLSVDRCTLRCKSVMRVMVGRPPIATVSLSMNNTLDLSETEVTLSARFPRVDDRAQSPIILNALKAAVMWAETHCIHRSSVQFLDTALVLPSSRVHYVPLGSWQDWAQLWGLPNNTSQLLAIPTDMEESGWSLDLDHLPPDFHDCGYRELPNL